MSREQLSKLTDIQLRENQTQKCTLNKYSRVSYYNSLVLFFYEANLALLTQSADYIFMFTQTKYKNIKNIKIISYRDIHQDSGFS